MDQSKKLKAYAAFAASFIILKQETDAQVIYTDIDPDKILAFDGQEMFLDMDSNGTDDFLLNNLSHTIYSIGYGYLWAERLRIEPQVSQNAIAGSVFYTGGNNIYSPYALAINDIINNGLSFQTYQFQRMAFRSLGLYDGDLVHEGGNWFPETEDHYLGVRFIDSDENNHYGWIRCDVTDVGRRLIIKDYAFELTPDKSILAGDSTHFANVNSLNELNATVYSFNKSIYVRLTEEYNDAEINIWTISGNNVYKKRALNKMQIISMELYTGGPYLVEIISADKKFMKKIFIE